MKESEGMVAAVSRTQVALRCEGESFFCYAPAGAPLAVGDRVVWREAGERRRILRVLPRKNRLSRLRGDRSRRSQAGYEQQVLAANLDLAVIVVAAQRPAFHPRLVDRYLVACQIGGVPAAVCMNKSDLAEPPSLAAYAELGLPTRYVSAQTGRGLAELQELLRGKTAVFVGASGVGKSSLLNRLLPEADIREGEISAQTGKGRHTTTASSLYEWEAGSLLIDTPGIRSLGLGDVDKNSLQEYFPEFSAYVGECKFRDCVHLHEPGCAVRRAVEEEAVSSCRYGSYRRLMEE